MTEFNDRVIAEFRSNRGRVGAWETSLVLVHHRGARTGKERVNPAMSLPDGDGWLVVGSAMGAARDPAWTMNLRANPDVEIEAVIDGEIATVPVRATELAGERRRAAFTRFVRSAPAFEKYQDRTSRPLPVIRFSRRSRETEAPGYTRDALIARLVRAGELEVSGEHQDELPNYFDAGHFAFHGPDGFDSDYDGLNGYFASIRAAFDDRSIRRGIIVAEGNRVACQTWIEGTFVREFTHSPAGPLPPNGQRVVWDLINIFTFDDHGRLVEEHVRTDYRSFLRQLGAEGR